MTAQPAIREVAIDRAMYAVDRATRTYRYSRRNPDWARLDPAANQRNKRSIDGYVRIFPDGRQRTFTYRPPSTRPSPRREGAFPDRERPPTRTDVVKALGDRGSLWDALAEWLAATYGLEPEPLYSGTDAGWVFRYRRSGRSLVTMMPMPGAIRAVVVIGPSIADRVAELDLQPNTRRALAVTHPYPDGRWLSLDVETPRDVEDITSLIGLKSPPPRRGHAAARRTALANPGSGR
jgi:hypothetical protein